MKDQSSFFEKVFEVVKLIPQGRATSYGAIAKFLGTPRSSRMVGYAMNASHSHHEFIPAHRVVNRNGMLTGKHHFPDPHIMEDMLNSEGINVIDDQIENFNDIFWDPSIELNEKFN